MKRSLKLSIFFTLTLLIAIFVVSCGGKNAEPQTDIGTTGLVYVDGVFKSTVEVDVESYDLSSKITTLDEASIVFSKATDFSKVLDGRAISLTPGDNLIFAKVTDNNGYEKIYKFNIYRKQMFTVEFDTDGGTHIDSITVKEGTIIEAPSTVKSGYTLSWDFDFSKPITSSKTVKALWVANDYGITIEDGDKTTVVAVKYGESYDLKEYEPEKVGYRFNGWKAHFANGEDTVVVPFNGADKYSYASNITITPVFEPVKYAITYVYDLGLTNTNTIIEFTIEDVIELLPLDWKDDEKVFAGWYTSPDFTAESKLERIENCFAPLTLWAKFDDVIFTSNVSCVVGDSVVESLELTYKAPYSLKAPTVDKGYAFAGWYFGETKLEMSGIWPYKDATLELTAQVVEIKNKLIYDIPDGVTNENPDVYSVGMGDYTLQNPVFANTKHNFLGWFTDPEFKNPINVINEDNAIDGMILYSKWEYNFDVEFVYDNGEDATTNTFTYGKAYELPTPIKAGNLFGGWYDEDGNNVPLAGTWGYKQDITLNAQWIPTTIALNYELNGGVQNENNPTSFGVYTGIIELYAPTRDKLVFAGWYTDAAFQNQITEIDTAVVREVVLYAKWIEENISVSYDANGGSVCKEGETIIYGTPYYLVAPELLGYKFEGWFFNNELVPTSGTWSIAVSEVKLVARWSVVTYKIEYDLDGAEIEGLVTEYNVNSNDIVLSKITREGYIFLGWEANGITSQTITIVKGSTGARSYKAIWCKSEDSKGFVYELVDDHMICVKYNREPSAERITTMPSEYFGYPVTAIASNAFTEFGVKFGASEYKNKDYYFTICIPQSITVIETDAFASCNGICIQLYKEDKSLIDSTKAADLAELLAWEEKVTYSSGASNKQVRDCIWGFRPAIGWSRYSAVEIPDFYE